MEDYNNWHPHKRAENAVTEGIQKFVASYKLIVFVLAGATPGTAGETAGFFARLTAYWLKQSQEQPHVALKNRVQRL